MRQGVRLFLPPRDQRPEAFVTVVDRDLGRDLGGRERARENRAPGDQERHQEGIDAAGRSPGDCLGKSAAATRSSTTPS